MCGEKNSCKACASEKKILQTSGIKIKIHAPKIFTFPPPLVISNGPSPRFPHKTELTISNFKY